MGKPDRLGGNQQDRGREAGSWSAPGTMIIVRAYEGVTEKRECGSRLA